jgi:hypothetical protein
METTYNPSQTAPVIVTTDNQLQQVLAAFLPSLVKDTLLNLKKEELKEQLLSPEETCKLFKPAITKPTLESYCEKGYLTKYYLSGRTWFKYSEVLQALKSIKRYSRNQINEA